VRALELAPDLALGHYRLGEARELRGDYSGAQECFARTAELDPKFGPGRYRLGRVMLWRAYSASINIWPDQRDEARAEAEQLVQRAVREIEAAQESGFDNDLHRELASAMVAYLRGEKETVHRICREGINRFGKKAWRSSTGSWAWSSSRRRRSGRPSMRRFPCGRSSPSPFTAARR